MKVIRRSIVLWNIILFSALSLVLFHISGSDLINSSAFSIEAFYAAKLTYVWLATLVGLTVSSPLLTSRVSLFFFSLVVLSVFISTSGHLLHNFNKLILVVLFIYLIVAYYYYQFLNIEIKQACYRPNFSKRNLFDPMLYKIECTLMPDHGEPVKGLLTNWDENGCFVKLDPPRALPSRFTLDISVQGEHFTDTAVVVSKLGNNQGYGLKFKNKSASRQTWQHFINYAHDMGLEPEIVQ